MTEAVMQVAHDLMASPWIYLVLFGFAALDAFVPIVPSESLVITAGVFAAAGSPALMTIMAAAAAGAIAGDHVSYAIGRRTGARVLSRIRSGTRRDRAYAWVQQRLNERGGVVLVVARYVPGGRTAATMTMGTIRFPLRSFSFFTVLAGTLWGIYCALVGYIGGQAFEENPLWGVVLGIAIAVSLALGVEYVRHVRTVRARTCPALQSSRP